MGGGGAVTINDMSEDEHDLRLPIISDQKKDRAG